ncbi:MAG: hypothetical protein AAF678_04245 [Pseudomonadota bacterium]
MNRKTLSTKSLTDRIETLTRRKTNLELQIEYELNEGAAEPDRLTRLRQEMTGLRDAIRVSRTVLSQVRARSGVMT